MLPLKISMQIEEMLYTLGWDETDDIAVEVGGTVVSGIQQPEGANKKWSLQFGERKYNNDAFIVVKNKSRDPFIPSKPNEENPSTPCPKCNDTKCSCPSV
jgi:hypothetical protein